jgi:hypothetical protein
MGGRAFARTWATLIALVAFGCCASASAHAASTLVTVAGKGATWPTGGAFSGDGGHAMSSAAALNRPAHVAALPRGGYLIADSSNQRIRKVSATGVLSTVAGNGSQWPTSTDPCGDGGAPLGASLRSRAARSRPPVITST